MSAYDKIIDLWQRQAREVDTTLPFGYAALKSSHDGTFVEQRFAVVEVGPDDLQGWFNKQPPGDRYFSPRIFSGPRSNATALPSRFLYADLDHDKLDTEQMPPFWLWETSHQSEQAIWQVDKVLNPAEHADHNKWLTYELDADLGGWHGSKLLRVPCTMNWKRQVRHDHSMVVPIGMEHSYHPNALLSHAKLGTHTAFDSPTSTPVPALIHRDDWNTYVSNLWPSLPLSVKATLETGVVKDRSRFLWRYYMACKETGVAQEVAFRLAWPMPWNKFTNPSDLWADMSKAWAR